MLGEFEAALAPEVDVNECHVRAQFIEVPQRLGAGRRHADDRDALALKQAPRGIDESRAVIND